MRILITGAASASVDGPPSQFNDPFIAQGVKKFILISFPHVEGPTTAKHPCTDRLDGAPISVHAQTRLAEEQYLFQRCAGTSMTPMSLRPGMIYGHDVLMVAFARKLARLRLLGVWRPATEIHVISITDFVACCQAAIENPASVSGRACFTPARRSPSILSGSDVSPTIATPAE